MATSNPFAGLALRNPEFAHDDAVAIAQEHFGVGGTPRELGSQQDQNVLLDDGGSRDDPEDREPRASAAARSCCRTRPCATSRRRGLRFDDAGAAAGAGRPRDRAGRARRRDVRRAARHLDRRRAAGRPATTCPTRCWRARRRRPRRWPPRSPTSTTPPRTASCNGICATPPTSCAALARRRPTTRRQRAQAERGGERFGAHARPRSAPRCARRHPRRRDRLERRRAPRPRRPPRAVRRHRLRRRRALVARRRGRGQAAGTVLHADPRAPSRASRRCCAASTRVLPLTEDEIEAMHALVLARAARLRGVERVSRRSSRPTTPTCQECWRGEWALLDAAAAMPEAVATAAWRAGLRAPVPCRAASRAVPSPAGGPLADGLDGRRSCRSTSRRSATTLRFDEPHRPRGAARTVDEAAARGVPVGRHGEPRLTSTPRPSADEPATIALGADLFLAAGTPVLAPLAGTVERAGADGLVLRLKAGGWLALGGLAPAPARRCRASRRAIGSAPCVEPARPTTRCPRACTCSRCSRCPTARSRARPALAGRRLAGPLRPTPRRCSAPTSRHRRCDDAARASSAAHVAAAQILYYERPPQIVRGLRQWLYGADGRAYLDVVNNVAVLGHSHPAVAEAAARQLRILNTNSRFLYPSITRYAERLAALLPEGLDTVFLVSSGSEANDLALRIAREVTGTPTCWPSAAPTTAGRPPRTRSPRRRSTTRRRTSACRTGCTRSSSPTSSAAPTAARTRPALRRRRARPAAALAEPAAAPPASSCEPLLGNSGGVELPDGYLAAGLRRRAGGRRPVHRRRGAGRHGAGSASASGPSSGGRRPRPRDPGQAGRERPAARRRRHHPRHRRALRPRRLVVLVHGRRADLLRGRPGGARRDRGRAAAGERARRRHAPAGAAARARGAPRAGRRGARRRALPGARARARPRDAGACAPRRRRRSASGCASGARSCSPPGTT